VLSTLRSIADINDWTALTPQDQDAVVGHLVSQLGRSWDYRESKSYGSNPAHRIPTFMHIPTALPFVLVPGGTFRMGLSEQEERALRRVAVATEMSGGLNKYLDNWRPSHAVRVRPFLMGQIPLTEALVAKLAGQCGLDVVAEDLGPDTAGRLSHDDCSTLAEACGFVLPSEAQWEYAFRAGTTTLFPFGDTLPNDGGWPNPTLDALLTTDFGDPMACQAAANPCGLSGMYVGEWCADTYQPGYALATGDDRAILGGEAHVYRSGSAWFWPWQGVGEWVGCISAARWGATAADDYLTCFRFVQSLADLQS